MFLQIAVVGVCGVVLIQLYLTTRIAARVGGLRNVLLTPARIWRPGHGIATIGKRMRPVRCDSRIDDCMGGIGKSSSEGEAVVIVADVRSVAARRMARVLGTMASFSNCPLRLAWYVAGSADQVERFVREVSMSGGCHHRISRRAALRASATGLPLAIYMDGSGVVRQMGFLADKAGLAGFVNGCASSAFRKWARTAEEERRGHGIRQESVVG